jgi:hypothetical protein
MALRIGFDLDGVLADMDSALAREAERVFGRATSKRRQATAQESDGDPAAAPAGDAPPVSSLHLTARQQRKLWQHVATIPNFWETLDEIEPGSIARLGALAAERRWETIFLTKRPATAGETAQRQSQRWLEAKGYPLPSVFVVQGSRGRIAAALGLDFVIDDRTENCLDVVVDSGARAILVWRDSAQRLPESARQLGIGVVPSVGNCLDILSEINQTDGGDTGALAKVMRLLGVKAPATA